MSRYKLVAGSESEIQETVNDLMDKGWTPQGGIQVYVVHREKGKIMYFQAMVRSAIAKSENIDAIRSEIEMRAAPTAPVPAPAPVPKWLDPNKFD